MSNRKTPSMTPNLISRLLSNAQQKRDVADTWDRSKQERRYAVIEVALKTNPKMTRLEDRKTVASNLDEILVRFERTGKGKKEIVLRKANMGVDKNSTKQLYHYTLPRDYAAPDNRVSKLIKRAKGYINLADKAAEIAGWDRKDILIDLFRGSTYDSEVSGAVPDLPDYLFSLQETLDRLNGWLTRETRIQWYYEMLRKFPEISDEWGNFVVNVSTSPLPYNANYSAAFYGKAIPGTKLYRVLSAELPVELVSDQKMDIEDIENNLGEYFEDGRPRKAPVEQLTFRRYFEVRLGLAPVRRPGIIRLVFDQRRLDELWEVQKPADPEKGTAAIEKWRAYSTIPFSSRNRNANAEWSSGDFYGAFEPPVAIVEGSEETFDELGLFGGWLRFTTLDQDSTPPSELFEDTAEPSINEDDALMRAVQDQFIEEVEPSTCQKYLNKEINRRIKCRWGVLTMPLECRSNTIAATIESALYTDDVEDRLDTSLQKAIEHRCSILELCLNRRKNVIAEHKEKLFSRWAPKKSNDVA